MKLDFLKIKEVSTPNIGDKRIDVKFAFSPIRLTNGDVIWLEKYKCLYEFRMTFKNIKLPEMEEKRGKQMLVSELRGDSWFPSGVYKNDWVLKSTLRI